MIWTSIWTDSQSSNDPLHYCGPLLLPWAQGSLSFTMFCGGSAVHWALVITQYFKSHFCPLLAPLLPFSSHKDSMCAEAKAPPSYYQPIVNLLTHTRGQWSTGWRKVARGWGRPHYQPAGQPSHPLNPPPPILTIIPPAYILLPSELLTQMRITLCCLVPISEQKKHFCSPEGGRSRLRQSQIDF